MIGTSALHEAQIIGVIDDAGKIGVLVVDANRHDVAAAADFAVEISARSAGHFEAPTVKSTPPVQGRSTRRQSRIVVRAAEQAELRGVARGLGEAEMAEGAHGDQAPARRALQKPLLDSIVPARVRPGPQRRFGAVPRIRLCASACARQWR